MTKQLASVDTNLDTFYSWILKTNSLVTLCNTEVVTANNSANGATTTGNGYVIGTFGANTLVATNLSGGNTLSTSTLTVTSNAHFVSNTNQFDTGVIFGANSLVYDSSVRYVAANSAVDQVVDTFSTLTWRSGKYIISITDPTTPQYQTTEILVLTDGNTTYTTEYATIVSNNQIATFRTDVSNSAVRLLVTPLISPIQINVSRELIAI